MGTFADGEKNKMLDAWDGTTTYTANAAVYAKLHLGDPGSAGTNNAAAETTRAICSFAAASGGTKVSDADIVWTAVSTAETYTWVSFWTASSGGTFLGKDDLPAAKTPGVGDNFQIDSGDVSLSI